MRRNVILQDSAKLITIQKSCPCLLQTWIFFFVIMLKNDVFSQCACLHPALFNSIEINLNELPQSTNVMRNLKHHVIQLFVYLYDNEFACAIYYFSYLKNYLLCTICIIHFFTKIILAFHLGKRLDLCFEKNSKRKCYF